MPGQAGLGGHDGPVTELLSRTPTGARPAGRQGEDATPVTALAAGTLVALTTLAISVLVLTVVVLLGWITATRSEASGAQAWRLVLQIWLLAHHGGFEIDVAGGARFGLVPLGVTVLVGLLLAGSASRAARAVGVRTPRSALRMLIALVLVYGMLALAVSPLASAENIHPMASQALVGAMLLAALAGGIGTVRGAGLGAQLRARLPGQADAALAAALAGAAALLGAGALLAGASLAWHAHRGADIVGSLGAGTTGSALLLLACLALLPNAVVWGTAFLLGPGFAVGTGTTVGPLAVHLGAVPAVPLLAALPATGMPAGLALPVMLVPLGAGVLTGLVAVRRMPGVPERSQLAWSAAAGAGTGLLLGLLAGFAGGPAGPGRLAAVGPSPWQVTLAAAAAVGTAAALTAWALPPRLRGSATAGQTQD